MKPSSQDALKSKPKLTAKQRQAQRKRQKSERGRAFRKRQAQRVHYDLVLLGAGVVGMYVALMLKERASEASILLIDQNPYPGKRFLATGNGRCNLAQRGAKASDYLSLKCSDDPLDSVSTFLKQTDAFDVEQLFETAPDQVLERFFFRHGILLREEEARLYPASFHAPSLVDYLTRCILDSKIECLMNTHCLDFQHEAKDQPISLSLKPVDEGETYEILCDRLVIATGGLAQEALGSGASMLEKLKKQCAWISPKPGLCPLCSPDVPKESSGLRLKACGFLMQDEIRSSHGEFLITDYGISGIASMDLSLAYARGQIKGTRGQIKGTSSIQVSKDWSRLFCDDTEFEGPLLLLDLFSDLDAAVLALAKEEKTDWSALLPRSLHLHLSHCAQKLIERPKALELLKSLAEQTGLSDPHLSRVRLAYYLLLRRWPLRISGTLGFDRAQLMLGGITLSNLANDLSLKMDPRVYLAGELLDLSGPCGGYNLLLCFLMAQKVAASLIEKGL